MDGGREGHDTPLFTMRHLFCRGCIICPTLHFDKESLDFGTTALGTWDHLRIRVEFWKKISSKILVEHETLECFVAQKGIIERLFSGFSTRQDVYLHNLALIPVAFTLTVLNDGDEMALTHEDFARSQTKPSFPSNPREFEVSPEEGVVASNDSMRIKVPTILLSPLSLLLSPFSPRSLSNRCSKTNAAGDLHG